MSQSSSDQSTLYKIKDLINHLNTLDPEAVVILPQFDKEKSCWDCKTVQHNPNPQKVFLIRENLIIYQNHILNDIENLKFHFQKNNHFYI